ncbi:MAG TPA: apolipoprotein N-acyltransferase, partial [Rhodobacteraceae bacterium]|nr:apolipoprotein N-acyltransferase [Paracoccaceae bacterium]
FQQARMRAIEQGQAVVRVANTGISAVIDPYGRVLKKIGLGHAGVIDSGLPEVLAPTLYSRYGDLVLLLFLMGPVGWLVYRQLRRDG